MKVYLNSSCEDSHCVQLVHYDLVWEHLNKYMNESDVKVWVGTEYTNQALYELITPEVRPGSFNHYKSMLLKTQFIEYIRQWLKYIMTY